MKIFTKMFIIFMKMMMMKQKVDMSGKDMDRYGHRYLGLDGMEVTWTCNMSMMDDDRFHTFSWQIHQFSWKWWQSDWQTLETWGRWYTWIWQQMHQFHQNDENGMKDDENHRNLSSQYIACLIGKWIIDDRWLMKICKFSWKLMKFTWKLMKFDENDRLLINEHRLDA